MLRFKATFKAASASPEEVITWSLKSSDPCLPAAQSSLLAASELAAWSLEGPADLNNAEATQGEAKLEVAGRWTGHNTGTELSGFVYFHAS